MDARLSSRERERQICRWLDSISDEAERIFLVGDVWEFWVEWRTVVPKGSVRLLGKLAELRDKGIEIEFFTGNHDLWMRNYLTEELGILTHREPILREFFGKKMLIGHGDGLGPGDSGYKFLKKIFTNPVCQTLFRALHPDFANFLGNFWSGRSREKNFAEDLKFLGAEKEWLIQYCEQKIKAEKIDYFVFGHRHLPIDWLLSNRESRYINLGDWMRWNTFAVLDSEGIKLKIFENEPVKIFSNH
jgi:UDP-2,3-diacylglucosamine hydrolase